MKRYSIFTAIFLCCLAPALAAGQNTPSTAVSFDIEGLWLVESGNGKVEVKDCGDGTPCGTLVWIDETQGDSYLDVNNADPKLRERPLLGSPVFWGFKKKGDVWKSGYIYDAEGGKTYKSKIKLTKDGNLKVKGCVGPICQSQIWVKATIETK